MYSTFMSVSLKISCASKEKRDTYSDITSWRGPAGSWMPDQYLLILLIVENKSPLFPFHLDEILPEHYKRSRCA